MNRFTVSLAVILLFISCAGLGGAASAEEYYSLGMAYFEVGKYAEAEKWLNRARMANKTMVASEYNLGRIAFETGRYEEALRYFNRILAKDPENALALKAAAYTKVKTGELEEAEALYERVLTLIPESADDGYNYALILFAMEKQAEAETVLLKYFYTLEDNNDALLLLARSQAAQDKAEAVDNYAKWLQGNTDSKIHYEYAQLLEKWEFYARALEEYRSLLASLSQGNTKTASQTGSQTAVASSKGPDRPTVRYAIGRLLLIADPENEEGIDELGEAVAEGFTDMEALKALLEIESLSDERKDDINRLITRVQPAPAVPVPEAASEEAVSGEPEKDKEQVTE